MDNTSVSLHTQQKAGAVAENAVQANCPNAPKMDPRVRRTRSLLENALRTLMSERPYDEISVADIAERATVNRATFYAHFLDKHDLAATMVRTSLHDTLLSKLPHEAPADQKLLRIATTVFEFMGDSHRACQKKDGEFASMIGPTLQETIESFVRTWLDLDAGAKRLFPGAPKDAAASVIGWSLYGTALSWSRQFQRPPLESTVAEVVNLLIHRCD